MRPYLLTSIMVGILASVEMGCNGSQRSSALVSEGMPALSDGLIACATSIKFAENDLSVSVRERDVPAELSSKLTTEMKLASICGYLVSIIKTSTDRASVQKFTETMKKAGYVSVQIDDTVFLYPGDFNNSGSDLDAMLDGKFADEMVSVIGEIDKDNEKLAAEFTEIAVRRKALEEASTALALLESKRDETKANNKKLADEIANLDMETSQLLATFKTSTMKLLGSGSSASFLTAERLQIRSDPLEKYNRDKDMMASVLKDELQTIVGKSYDSDDVTHKFAHPDLVNALDRFVASEAKTLTEVGLKNFVLAGAARTPGQQAKLDSPIKASMFGSGHIYGAAIDFNKSPEVDLTPYYTKEVATCRPPDLEQIVKTGKYSSDPAAKKQQEAAMVSYLKDKAAYTAKYDFRLGNWKKLSKAMARHGLSLNLPYDPNHVFLASFVAKDAKSRKFANALRLRMIRAYQSNLTNQLQTLAAQAAAAGSEQARISRMMSNIDQQVAVANEVLKELEAQRAKLDRDLATSVQKNSAAKRAWAEILASRAKSKEERREYDRHRERAGQKDAYWSRDSYKTEIHRDELGRECVYREHTREDSRGDWSRERSIECGPSRGNDSSRGGYKLP